LNAVAFIWAILLALLVVLLDVTLHESDYANETNVSISININL